MLFWPLNPIYTQIPNSPTSIIWGQTNFPSSLTTISGFLNRCFFDLSTRFVLKFRLPDLDYPRFDQVLTIIGQYYKFLQQMFFWPLNPRMTHIRTPWPRKPRVQLSSNHHWSLLWVSKTNVFLTFEPDLYSNSDSLTSITQGPTKSQPSLVTISEFLNRCSFDPDANRQTNKQTNEFFSYDPPYSRGNILFFF